MILRQLEYVKNKLNFHMNGQCLCDKVHNGELAAIFVVVYTRMLGPWPLEHHNTLLSG
jgi:hypothetical protein